MTIEKKSNASAMRRYSVSKPSVINKSPKKKPVKSKKRDNNRRKYYDREQLLQRSDHPYNNNTNITFF